MTSTWFQRLPAEFGAINAQTRTPVVALMLVGGNSTVFSHASITDAILEYASNYDAFVVGATGRGLLPKLLFGQIPENIAKRSDRAVILVKTCHPVKGCLAASCVNEFETIRLLPFFI